MAGGNQIHTRPQQQVLKYLFFLNLHTKKGQGRDTVMYCLSALNY